MTKTIKLVETKSTPASVVSAGNEAEGKEGLVFRIPMKRKVPDSSSDTPSAGLKSSKNTPVIKIQNNQIVKPKQEQKEVAQPVDRLVYSTVTLWHSREEAVSFVFRRSNGYMSRTTRIGVVTRW